MEWDDNIGVFHSRLDKVIVGGFDKFLVHLQDFLESAISLCSVSLDPTAKPYIVRAVYEYFEVHHVAESTLVESMDTFEEYYGCRINGR